MRHIALIGFALLIATHASADDVGNEPTLYATTYEPTMYGEPEVEQHQEVEAVSQEPEVEQRSEGSDATMGITTGLSLAGLGGVLGFVAGRRL